VVYRSSETSTKQSDVIIRSDDRFLNLVVDSYSIVSKIYMHGRIVSKADFSKSGINTVIYDRLAFICELKRALYGIKCVLWIFLTNMVEHTIRVPGFSGIGRTREGTRLQDHLCALC
jgi:hypothetical protein